MGTMKKDGEKHVYIQDDGEITAIFHDSEEKMILVHEGSSTYKKVFYLLVLVCAFYLAGVFLFSSGNLL
jgi:hypothetical protein